MVADDLAEVGLGLGGAATEEEEHAGGPVGLGGEGVVPAVSEAGDLDRGRSFPGGRHGEYLKPANPAYPRAQAAILTFLRARDGG